MILAYSDTYHEYLVLNKALTLRGRGAIIDGGGTGTLLSLTANGATVKTLTLKNGNIGVGLRGATANRLAGLRITRAKLGIVFSSSATGNLVTDTDIGHAKSFAVDGSIREPGSLREIHGNPSKEMLRIRQPEGCADLLSGTRRTPARPGSPRCRPRRHRLREQALPLLSRRASAEAE